MGVSYQNITACGTLQVLVTQTQIIANEAGWVGFCACTKPNGVLKKAKFNKIRPNFFSKKPKRAKFY